MINSGPTRRPGCRYLVAFIMVVCGVLPVIAAPQLNRVQPAGGQRGTECSIVLRGERLRDPQGLLFYRPGIEVVSLEMEGDQGKSVKATLKITGDCPLGEHPLRLRTATGLTELRTFQVGPFPALAEKEPNNDLKTPQPVPLNHTITGKILSEDVDYFQVELKKGQAFTAEIEAMRLGMGWFDPHLAILDTNRFELAASDDTALLKQDALVSFMAPYDGTYLVQLREASYGGNEQCVYRLHLGSFRQPLVVYPPGGPAGQPLAVRYLGDIRGEFDGTVTVPGETGLFNHFPEVDNLSAPAPVWLRAAPFANVLETEPNQWVKQVNRYDQDVPVAFNGVIAEAGDQDCFLFKAKKDRQYDIQVYARRLRSPLDPVVQVYNKDGKWIKGNDDSRGMDSYYRFKAPRDDEFMILVRDHLKQGSPNHVYRVEVTPVQPSFSLNVPVFEDKTQQRHTVVVPRGNRYGAVIAAKREDFGDALQVVLDGLPPEVRVEIPPMPKGTSLVPLIFTASTNAPLTGGLLACSARAVDAIKEITGAFRHKIDLVYGEPNKAVFYSAVVDHLAMAVAEPAPFSIELETPKVPLVHGGSMDLKITARRNEGFSEPIRLRMMVNPPGVSSATEITIPKDQQVAYYRINASGGEERTWPIAVIGAAKVKGGDRWVSTGFADLTVSAPYVSGQIDMAVVTRGESAEIVCRLDHRKPFTAPARIRLLGLPPHIELVDKEKQFTPEDQEVVFAVKAGEKSPIGKHKSLFCSLEIPHNGASIQQSIAGGGTLRIDPPAKKKPEVAQKQPAPAKPAAEKRLSRLEQLREQAKAGKGDSS